MLENSVPLMRHFFQSVNYLRRLLTPSENEEKRQKENLPEPPRLIFLRIFSPDTCQSSSPAPLACYQLFPESGPETLSRIFPPKPNQTWIRYNRFQSGHAHVQCSYCHHLGSLNDLSLCYFVRFLSLLYKSDNSLFLRHL